MESHRNVSPVSLPAQGPEGLRKLLNSLYEKYKLNATTNSDHFILYQFGNQKSLIHVSMAERPCKFWYYDLDARPAPSNIKNIINEFLLQHYPNSYQPKDFSKQVLDFYELEKHERVFASIENGVPPEHPKEEAKAKERLLHAIEHDAWSKIMPVIDNNTVGYERNNFFSGSSVDVPANKTYRTEVARKKIR